MATYTSSLPLSFWSKVLARIANETAAQEARLGALLKPTVALVDTADVVRPRVQQSRLDAIQLLNSLELLSMLETTLELQLRTAEHQAGIPELECWTRCYGRLMGLFERHMCGLPNRLPVEEDLSHAVSSFQALKNAGQGESIQAERQRLRNFQAVLPVVGYEDGLPYEDYVRTLRARMDSLETEIHSRRSETYLVVQVEDGLAAPLARLGVSVSTIEQPQEVVVTSPASNEVLEALPVDGVPVERVQETSAAD